MVLPVCQGSTPLCRRACFILYSSQDALSPVHSSTSSPLASAARRLTPTHTNAARSLHTPSGPSSQPITKLKKEKPTSSSSTTKWGTRPGRPPLGKPSSPWRTADNSSMQPTASSKWKPKNSETHGSPVPHTFRNEHGLSALQKSPEKLFQEIREEMGRLDGKTPLSSLQIITFNQTVADLRSALRVQNVELAWEHWKTLKDEGLLSHLGPADLESFTRQLPLLIPQYPAKWPALQREAIEDMALFSAAGNYEGPLKECMLYHIRCGDAEKALSLFQRYRSSADNRKTWDSPEENEEDLEGVVKGDDTFAFLAPSNPFRYSIGTAELMLCAIASHAVKHDFSGAIKLYVEAGLRINNITSETLLAELEGHAAQETVRTWLPQLETARLISRPSSLANQVNNLVAGNQHEKLKVLYRNVCAAFDPPLSWLAATSGELSPQRPVLMPAESWATFISGFLRIGVQGTSASVWDDMVMRGAQPGVQHWTAVIDGQVESGATDKVLRTWKAMLDSGVKPDAMAHRAIINGRFKHGDWKEAMDMFEEFKNSSVTEHDKSLLVHNVVIRGLLAYTVLDAQREQVALTLFEQMRAHGPKPDIVTFNTLLAYYARRRNMKALAMYMQMINDTEGIKCDSFTLSTILSALLKVGRTDAPDLMLNVMARQGVQPTIETFTSIIRSIITERDEAHVKACLDILTRLESDARPAMQPNVVTYSTLISGIVRGQFLPPQLEDEYVQAILQRMTARGIRPDRSLYHTLVATSLQQDSPNAVPKALTYFKEMQRRGMLTRNTWFTLLQGLVRREELDTAGYIVDEMMRAKVVIAGPLHRMAMHVKMAQQNGRKTRSR